LLQRDTAAREAGTIYELALHDIGVLEVDSVVFEERFSVWRVTKPIDEASERIFRHAASDDELQFAVLTMGRPAKVAYRLVNLRITNYATSSGGARPFEQFSLQGTFDGYSHL
jgi:hypothetical protein